MVAYAVFLHESTVEPSEMQAYAGLVRSTTVDHPVTMLAQHGAFEVLEGAPIEGAVLLQFPSMADAKAWYHSPLYQEVAQHRLAGATFRVVLVEGVG